MVSGELGKNKGKKLWRHGIFEVRWEKSAEIKQDWIKAERTTILSSISDASFGT